MVPAGRPRRRARPHPADRRRRGHGRVQPRRRHPRAGRHLPRRGREPALVRRAVHLRARARRPRPHARPRQRRARGRARASRRVRDASTSTSSTAAPARPSTTGAARSTTPSPSTRRTCPPTRSRSRPARRSPSTRPGTPTTTTRPTSTSPPPSASAQPASTGTRSRNWSRARPRVPAQPPLLDDGGVPGHRLRLPLAPRRPPVLEPAHPRPLHRRGRAAASTVEAADERLDDDARALEALQLSLRTRHGVPAGALDADGLPGLVEPHPDDADRLVLTVDGRLLANEVALRLAV